jgi:hypothetical protein
MELMKDLDESMVSPVAESSPISTAGDMFRTIQQGEPFARNAYGSI